MKISRFFAALVALSLGAACTAPLDAQRVLEDQGMTDVTTGGYALWQCSEDDTFATKFEATAPSGRRVSGAVCQGLMKGSTIRYD